ncbi:hypothetical protein [Mycobacterium sp. OTB74]|jgi:hypothetical protein|uniref:hypothetical protein n=1 Tax=Mycobacterium sp. OTB74 TaxID=1853452 RepID=UPI0024746E45|nr:hypothetical protein [Mycobacterium sp. OTB74]MDH6245523.1 hypothetical protein [Mycobacterium sp. OTB74]
MSDPVRVDNVADQIAQLPVNVFHGTRVSMAERIMRGGFAPLSVAEQIEAVAVAHDVPVEALMDDLTAYNRFAVVDQRPDTVFVTGHPVKAGSWADRAPEATWEALWAVYRIRHPEIGWYWNSSQQGHLWVQAQRLADPPALLLATAPLGALRDRGDGRTAADLFADVAEAADLDEALETAQWLFRVTPEWLVAPADITARGHMPVPMRVEHPLAYFMSGETSESFGEQLRSDFWGEPGAVTDGDDPWHPFDQVWARLSVDRQVELEELVGVPVTSLLAAAADEVVELVAES